MHELAVTQSLLDAVLNEAQAARANKVTRVNLIIGELSGAVIDSIQFYFDILKKDTAADGATIDFKSVPAQLKCRDCQKDFHPQDDAIWLCPDCGSYSIEIIQGRDCYLESIEVEQ